MYMELTRRGDGAKIFVDANQVKLIEPDSDGLSTHIVLGADLVRVVSESPDKVKEILSAVGVAG